MQLSMWYDANDEVNPLFVNASMPFFFLTRKHISAALLSKLIILKNVERYDVLKMKTLFMSMGQVCIKKRNTRLC